MDLSLPSDEPQTIATFLTADAPDGCGLTVQQLGTLVGCSPPTVYRILGGKNASSSVIQRMLLIRDLLRGTLEGFRDVDEGARVQVVQRLARQTTDDRIWESGFLLVAKNQLAAVGS